jgi:hypothetical protein
MLDDRQARVVNVSQGLPGLIAYVADHDDLRQGRVILREERHHSRPDRALAVLHRDDDADVRPNYRLEHPPAITPVSDTMGRG